MHLDDIGELIATRKLSLLCKDGTLQEILVKLGKPRPFPNSEDFYCPFQILGVGDEKVRAAAGVDAIQALQLVMSMIGADLDWLNRQYGGSIYWLDGVEGLGFPTIEHHWPFRKEIQEESARQVEQLETAKRDVVREAESWAEYEKDVVRFTETEGGRERCSQAVEQYVRSMKTPPIPRKQVMKLADIGEVMAQRRLTLEGAPPGQESVTVRIGKPREFPDSPGWYCPFQIVGAGSEKVKYAAGADAVQALQLVMKMIGADLDLLNQQYEGKLRWEGGEPGFPETG